MKFVIFNKPVRGVPHLVYVRPEQVMCFFPTKIGGGYIGEEASGTLLTLALDGACRFIELAETPEEVAAKLEME